MSTPQPVRFLKADGRGRYYVVDGLGRTLGEVYRHEEHYNLQRPVTVKTWRIVGQRGRTFGTRAKAAAFLVWSA